MFDPDTCYDVAVLSGGLCGFAAARSLALKGHRVALIERRPVLGWEVAWAFHVELGEVTCDTARWLAGAMTAAGCPTGAVDPTIAEMLLDREAARAGIEVLLHAQPVAVAEDEEEGTLAAVSVGTKSGEMAVRARAFLDATENALVWRLAGARDLKPFRGAARQTVVLNGFGSGRPAAPVRLGSVGGVHDVVVRATAWPGEVAVEFGLSACDVHLARRALPDLLRHLRDSGDAFAKALVTSVGVEPYPLNSVGDDRRQWWCERSDVGNLFAAGSWRATGRTARALTLAERLAIGEDAAAGLAEALDKLPEASQRHVGAPSRVAPPAHQADVVVCGGGTGGALAAIAAARQGAKTVLIEQSTCLGGIGTGGGIHSYYHGVAGGLQDELDRRVAELAPLFGPAAGFHPEAKKVALELMAAEAGVELVYNATITGVQAESAPSSLPSRTDGPGTARRLRAVVAAGPEGNATYRAKVFVDATGDGDVAAMAGAEFTFGRATDGLPHAFSLAAGRLGDDGKLLITNFDAGYCDPTDPVDLTRARRHALGHYWRERFDAKNRLVYIAPILGLRNSRQVVGDYRLTMADEIEGRQFPDVIAYAYSHYDNHGFDYENESDEAMLWVWLLGNWSRCFGCEIPYRCLLPAGIEGLLMACRALSMTHDAHNQLRMQRDLQRIGEAAGVAAALAAKRGLTPRQLPVVDLQAVLLASGALGPREQPKLPEPAKIEAALHDSSWLPPQVPALPSAERITQLGTDRTSEATWDLIRKGDEALPLLLDAARAEKPATRFWASVALAMLRRPEAAPELRAALAERRAEAPEGRKTAPLWRSAAVLLGRIGDRQAVPELCQVLEDRGADLDSLIAAVRALGRIGDDNAVPALNALVERMDLPAERILQVSSPGGNPVREDARWQLDLAAAEALARLGKPRPDIAERHAKDERAYVRAYARRVAGEPGL
ncbi:MAG TPA: FAD-dependent oxidoreductase [Planctomycetota bacterium]|nr:FAD-dependent oxidoreductase [Planctomycetota bacterium]HRR82035.1 FAD-dependent oxidoreductase [Planctomycetota bacterium]HRT93569.1 FAD-dependent oxidoreductase [Planctomycetota bacterium]